MMEKIRKILEDNNIELNVGMTENEISKAEEFYGIEFPKDMKELLILKTMAITSNRLLL